jgi:hypothetical protein
MLRVSRLKSLLDELKPRLKILPGPRKTGAALSEATKANLLYHQYDAQVALGEVEIKSGKTSAGYALNKDSTSKGFLIIAGKVDKAEIRKR